MQPDLTKGPDPRSDPVAAAQLIEAIADRAEATLHEVQAYHRDDVWRGVVAARFGEELADQRRRMRIAVDELRQQSATLRARAAAGLPHLPD